MRPKRRCAAKNQKISDDDGNNKKKPKRRCVVKDQQISDDGDKNKKKAVINSLGHDSIAKIIMLLPIPERIEMEKVCTKWKEACQLAWYDITKYKCESSIGRCYDNRLLTQSYLKEILLRCGIYLKELSLSNDVCNSSIMPFIGDHCKNLTTLECKFYDNPFIDHAHHFVLAFAQLVKLKCIKITVAHSCYDEIINMSAIINSLPEEMNEIHLFFEPRWDRKQDIHMSVKKFKNLQKLTVHSLNLDNIILQEISEITTLVYLSLQPCDINHGFPLFNNLVNLEYIDLTMGTRYNEAKNFSTEILNTIFCTCKNLKYLDIPSSSYDLTKIPRKKWINFQNLEYLGIAYDVKHDLANSIVKYCKNLKHLRIHHDGYSMTDTAIKDLTELENLESLILPSHIRFCNESIIAISNNCKKLKRLEIPHCYIQRLYVRIIDGNFFSSSSVLVELSKLQYLEHLNLYHVESLKDIAISVIAYNCKNLKTLNIQYCQAITERGLDALTNLKNLQKLNVSYLRIITDSFLIKLKGMKELNCKDCSGMTDAGIIQFIKNNPDLEFLDICDTENLILMKIIEGADQATKNRTNGIILHINADGPSYLWSMIKSQWLDFGYEYNILKHRIFFS